MLLQNKTAVIYGAGGAVGGAVARAFAREGAAVYLAGRTAKTLGDVADAITAAGGECEVATVDALNEEAVEAHMESIIGSSGAIDISFNAISLFQKGIQGTPLLELSVENFSKPIDTYTRSHFLTARAAGRRMAAQGAGVIMLNTPTPSRSSAPLIGGMGPAWAAIEALSRDLSAELAGRGVRTVVLRSTGMPETATIDVVYGLHSKAMGITVEHYQAIMDSLTHTHRPTTLAEVAEAAVFAASGRVPSMTGAVINLTAGGLAD
jgi:NAD(P)-dependent dehydrogenase (short-subunit alcohol dehydrogenase family)